MALSKVAKLELDRTRLLELFPQELWNIITDFLTDATSMEILYSHFPFFRKNLEARRTQFLFPSVLPHLLKTGYLDVVTPAMYPSEPHDDPTVVLCASCGELRYLHFYSDILKLRMICKTWCDAVDNTCENDPMHFMLMSYPQPKPVYTWTETHFDDENADIIKRHFKSAPNQEKNPFIGRSLSLTLEDDDHNPFSEESRTLKTEDSLEKHGHHFWYCKIYVKDDSTKRVNYYRKLRKWLFFLPNLKVLRIQHSPSVKLSVPPQNDDEKEDEENGIALMGDLPVLPELKFLSTVNVPSYMFNALVTQNNHFTKLEAKREVLHEYRGFFRGGFEILRELSLRLLDEVDFNQLIMMNELALEKLTLDCNGKVFMTWERLFELLGNKWGNTLETVTIQLSDFNGVRDEPLLVQQWNRNMRKFPKLQHFKVVGKNASLFLVPFHRGNNVQNNGN